MQPIHSVYIDGTDRDGFTFGVDQVTPVRWIFSNRVPKSAFSEYTLKPYSENVKVQEWIQQNNKTVVMSYIELKNKILELAK